MALENFDPNKVTSNTNVQKQAILTALAQGGSDLAKSVAQGQGQVDTMQGAAMQQALNGGSAAAGNPQFQQEQAGRITGQADYYRNLMGAQGASQQRGLDAGAAANSNYMDQVNAAVPIAHEQTQRELNSLQSAADQSAADRALRLQLGQMQLQESQARLSAAGADDDPNSLDNQYKQAQINRMNAETGEIGKPAPLSPSDEITGIKLADIKKREALLGQITQGLSPNSAAVLRTAFNSGDGTLGGTTAAMNALVDSKTFKTPAGKKLDPKFYQRYIADYFSKL